jgi:hypothetical protein
LGGNFSTACNSGQQSNNTNETVKRVVMDNPGNDILAVSIAFLDVMTFENGKAFRGGIFVTDINTYPLEFRVTTPIRPTPLQTVLYGGTLEDYIYIELVALPLLESIKSKPAFVFVSSERFLNARPRTHLPIFHLTNVDDFKIKTHLKYRDELHAERAIIGKIKQSLLFDAFSRIRAGLQEAHRQRVGDK